MLWSWQSSTCRFSQIWLSALYLKNWTYKFLATYLNHVLKSDEFTNLLFLFFYLFLFFSTKENPLEDESTINQAWNQVQSSKATQKTTIMAY